MVAKGCDHDRSPHKGSNIGYFCEYCDHNHSPNKEDCNHDRNPIKTQKHVIFVRTVNMVYNAPNFHTFQLCRLDCSLGGNSGDVRIWYITQADILDIQQEQMDIYDNEINIYLT